ncbi:MAG: HU family DNA-binding protein [Candidatus Komeilibacteria bacterium]
MNKAKLIETIAEKTSLGKKEVEAVIDAFTDTTTNTLLAGDEVSLTGFGTFSARLRTARQGVNPLNPKEKIMMPAVTVPKFKAGKNLKDRLKGRA